MIIPDGCAVDVYAVLPVGNAPDLVHDTVPHGASILDLGAGKGGLAYPLIDLGHEVVAVDESLDMLSHLRGVQAVRRRIEDLYIDRTFDVVLLVSHLANIPDEMARGALLAACRCHVSDDGVVLIERLTRDWVETVESSSTTDNGLTTRLEVLDRTAAGRLNARVHYLVAGRHWTQTFTARGLNDHELCQQLASAGLRFDRHLDEEGE